MGDAAPYLTPDLTPEAGFVRIAGMCGAAFARHLRGVLAKDDPEGPHRARVALRRLRTALGGFAPILDPAARRALADEARALFRSLGRLRDADVMRAACTDPAQLDHLTAEADRIRAEVRDEMRRAQADHFAQRLEGQLADTGWQRTDGRWGRRGLGPLGRRALTRTWAACRVQGKGLIRLPDTARHEFRKSLKTLRYLSEFFAPFWPGPRHDHFLGHLRALQDALGTLNDLALARALTGATGPAPGEAAALQQAATAWKALVRSGPWWDQATRRP